MGKYILVLEHYGISDIFTDLRVKRQKNMSRNHWI